ncbi:MAG: hypothetical protein KME29_31560 [Calothrix sp. FI2-JRJ7]|nr:hypothetical protein [Calothrix sp. FI2-JRJ7]
MASNQPDHQSPVFDLGAEALYIIVDNIFIILSFKIAGRSTAYSSAS